MDLGSPFAEDVWDTLRPGEAAEQAFEGMLCGWLGSVLTRPAEQLRSEMPRYFFHLRCAGKDIPDSAGADLRDPDQAWEAARTTARDLIEVQLQADVNWLTCRFEVTD